MGGIQVSLLKTCKAIVWDEATMSNMHTCTGGSGTHVSRHTRKLHALYKVALQWCLQLMVVFTRRCL